MDNDKNRKENIVEIKDLFVTFDVKKKTAKMRDSAEPDNRTSYVRAIDGVTMDIKRGEVLAVVGESGCGKTTLGKAILHIAKSSGGSIKYNGAEITTIPKPQLHILRQKMQLIFQDPYESLNPRQNVYQTLLEPLIIHYPDMSKEDKRKKIYQYMESVGLLPVSSMEGRYPHHLSGGQRQRLSIAATMILEPDFVVADEPVSMLDVSIRAEILKLMLDLQKGRELTYMFITHDLSLAWMIADRIAVFYLGKLVEIGPADRIVHHCLHPYAQALVSVIPKMENGEEGQKAHVLKGETPSPMNVPQGCRFHSRCWLYQQKGEPVICRTSEPELVAVGEDHCAACHFAL